MLSNTKQNRKSFDINSIMCFAIGRDVLYTVHELTHMNSQADEVNSFQKIIVIC